MDFSIIKDCIAGSTADMIELETLLTAHPALAPESGGQGELEKVLALEAWLRERGITQLERFDAPDSRVESGIRPNLVATIPGHQHAPHCRIAYKHKKISALDRLRFFSSIH